jgi:hypothetical protein
MDPEEQARHQAEVARQRAMDNQRAEATRIAAEAMGNVPLHEMLSWPIKEAAARRFLAKEATDQDLTMLQAEVAETGETLEQLARMILRKADEFRFLTARLTGERRRVRKGP